MNETHVERLFETVESGSKNCLPVLNGEPTWVLERTVAARYPIACVRGPAG